MISYALQHDANKCFGCTACVQICKAKAITMKPDEEGFLYPDVDQQRCSGCGLCSTVCPAEKMPRKMPMKALYAVMNKDEEALQKSSSGGMFRLIADYVLEQHGCVVGCVWDHQNRPKLKVTENADELLKMQGSKYLYSNPLNVFVEVRERLEKGQMVLFTGTPCQNAGLLNYLQKPYEQLITVDFLCHGVPSQKVFDAYVENLEKRYHGKVENFQFRDKSARGWGHVESFCVSHKRKIRVGNTSPYLYGFIRGYFNRYSCYVCPFRGKRITDFTMCDYWGISKHHTSFEKEKGVSAVSVNTERAEKLFRKLKDRCQAESTKAEWVAEENPAILRMEHDEIPPQRRIIFTMLASDGWRCVEKRFLVCKYRAFKQLWYKIPSRVAKVIKCCLKRG